MVYARNKFKVGQTVVAKTFPLSTILKGEKIKITAIRGWTKVYKKSRKEPLYIGEVLFEGKIQPLCFRQEDMELDKS